MNLFHCILQILTLYSRSEETSESDERNATLSLITMSPRTNRRRLLDDAEHVVLQRLQQDNTSANVWYSPGLDTLALRTTEISIHPQEDLRADLMFKSTEPWIMHTKPGSDNRYPAIQYCNHRSANCGVSTDQKKRLPPIFQHPVLFSCLLIYILLRN